METTSLSVSGFYVHYSVWYDSLLYGRCGLNLFMPHEHHDALAEVTTFSHVDLLVIVILTPALMDETILHEMAHIKHHHHRKSFWNYLSTLLGSEAKEKKMIYDIAISKYWELYTFLMK